MSYIFHAIARRDDLASRYYRSPLVVWLHKRIRKDLDAIKRLSIRVKESAESNDSAMITASDSRPGFVTISLPSFPDIAC